MVGIGGLSGFLHGAVWYGFPYVCQNLPHGPDLDVVPRRDTVVEVVTMGSAAGPLEGASVVEASVAVVAPGGLGPAGSPSSSTSMAACWYHLASMASWDLWSSHCINWFSNLMFSYWMNLKPSWHCMASHSMDCHLASSSSVMNGSFGPSIGSLSMAQHQYWVIVGELWFGLLLFISINCGTIGIRIG